MQMDGESHVPDSNRRTASIPRGSPAGAARPQARRRAVSAVSPSRGYRNRMVTGDERVLSAVSECPLVSCPSAVAVRVHACSLTPRCQRRQGVNRVVNRKGRTALAGRPRGVNERRQRRTLRRRKLLELRHKLFESEPQVLRFASLPVCQFTRGTQQVRALSDLATSPSSQEADATALRNGAPTSSFPV